MRPDRIVLIGALGVQSLVSVFFIVKNQPWLTDDSLGYINLATSLLNGLGFGKSCPFGFLIEPSRLPGYPAFLAVIYYIFGQVDLYVIICQTFLLLASVYFTYRVAEQIFDQTAARIFLVVATIYPFVASAAAFISPEILSLFFVSAALYLWRDPRPSNLALAGVSLSLATFSRPNLILLGLIIAALCLVLARHSRLKYLLVAAVIPLCLLPWALRNYYTFGKFTPTAVVSGVGVSVFVASWESRISTRTLMEFGRNQVNQEAIDSGLKRQIEEISSEIQNCCPLDEQNIILSVATCETIEKQRAVDNAMLKKGIQNISEAPAGYLLNVFSNVFRMWFTYFGLDDYPWFIRFPLIFLGMGIMTVGLVGLIIALLTRQDLRDPTFISVTATLIYFPATQAWLNTQGRYSIPARLLLIMFASYAIAYIWMSREWIVKVVRMAFSNE